MSFGCCKPCGDQNKKIDCQFLVATINDQNFQLLNFLTKGNQKISVAQIGD
jgi:hypothetical protein